MCDKEHVSLDLSNYKEPEESCICFNIEDKELLKLDKEGITLNRENFPDYKPDDFVKEFIDIMERNYDIKFEKLPRNNK